MHPCFTFNVVCVPRVRKGLINDYVCDMWHVLLMSTSVLVELQNAPWFLCLTQEFLLWCNVSSQNSHVVMHGPTFTVGQGPHCDLWVKDPAVSNLLCNLKHTESEVCSEFLFVNMGSEFQFVMVSKAVTFRPWCYLSLFVSLLSWQFLGRRISNITWDHWRKRSCPS